MNQCLFFVYRKVIIIIMISIVYSQQKLSFGQPWSFSNQNKSNFWNGNFRRFLETLGIMSETSSFLQFL